LKSGFLLKETSGKLIMSYRLKDVEADLEFDKVRQIVTRECRSACGSAYLLSVEPFETEQEAFDELLILSEIRSLFQTVSSFPCYGRIDDKVLSDMSLSGAVLDGESLLKIRETLQNVGTLKNLHLQGMLEGLVSLSLEVEELFFDEGFLRELERTLDSDGTILESASPELAAARREQASLTSSIQQNLNGYLKGDRYKECFGSAYITTINDRFVIPVYSNFKGRIGGVIQGTSNSGNSVFVEPMKVVEMNNSLMSARAREKAEVRRIMASLTASATVNHKSYAALSRKLAWFDSLYARGRYADSTSSSIPIFSKDRKLNLYNVRHPLLGAECIPLSLTLDGNQSIVILSGANSGGKTVTLKTVGLAALMARTGFHILAGENSSLPFFSSIFVEIGDRQSIAENLSSFSSHIRDIAQILEKTRKGSLILFDEIMSGTDPEEGAALAESVLIELSKRGCLVIATTHFGSLKMLSGKNPRFQNCAVEFDRKTFRPTFRLLSNIPGASYGFEIARRFGLPSDIVDSAGELLGDGRHRISDLVIKLEAELTDATNMAEKHRVDSLKSTEIREKLQKERERFEREKDEKLENLLESERAALLEFRKDVEEKLRFLTELSNRELSRGEPSDCDDSIYRNSDGTSSRGPVKVNRGELLRQIDTRLVSMKSKHRQRQSTEVMPVDLEPGVRVKTLDNSMSGTVVSVNKNKGTARVDCGGIELTIDLSEIKSLNSSSSDRSSSGSLKNLKDSHKGPGSGGSSRVVKAEHQQPAKRTAYVAQIKSELPYELDLRGLRVHEALEKVEHHIDLAIARHERSVRIIHGKGTGALKRAVEEYLHSHYAIKSYRRGEQGEGDFGVTIATL
jgi:DNA mismatch repair protein MutS2